MRTIIQMVQLTRLDCAIASAGIMRMALAQAIHHARHRTVFQKHLADQPMMQAVLADMALEVEAATALGHAALPFVRSRRERSARGGAGAAAHRGGEVSACARRAPAFVYEAMECLGGNGYVEESVLPRLYREAPVNAIWEGSGNVMCLDVLRALAHEGEAGRAVLGALGGGRGRPAGRARGRPLRSRRCCRRPDAEAKARAAVETSGAAGGGRRACATARRPKSPSCLRARGSRAATTRCSEQATSARTTPAACSNGRCHQRDESSARVLVRYS